MLASVNESAPFEMEAVIDPNFREDQVSVDGPGGFVSNRYAEPVRRRPPYRNEETCCDRFVTVQKSHPWTFVSAKCRIMLRSTNLSALPTHNDPGSASLRE